MSNNIYDEKMYASNSEKSNEVYEQKIYELGDLNPRRSLSGDIAVYNFNTNLENNMIKKKWEVNRFNIFKIICFWNNITQYISL